MKTPTYSRLACNVYAVTKWYIFLFFIFIFNNCAHAQSITINTGMNLVMNGSVNLVVNSGAFINNGTFNAGNASTVTFRGYADSATCYINGTSTSTFNNFTVNKADGKRVQIKSQSIINNVLTVSTGFLHTGNLLTLRSIASLTARVATIPDGSNIYGNTNVEKYYPAKRAWRLVTAPVTGGNTIYESWQNSGAYISNRGTYISGPNASIANGLDESPQNNYSLKKWDVATQSLLPITNTYTSLNEGNAGAADNTGYFMFIRGDRTYGNFNTTTCNTTTITSTGNLQVGTQTFAAATTASAYTLVGNPYASPVDFSAINRTNIVNRFYIWDPTINALGAYVMLDDISNTGSYTKSVSGSNQTKHIQSSQAFFVQTSGNGSANISFDESHKSNGSNNLVARQAHRTANGAEMIRINVYIDNIDGTKTLADGVFAEFDNQFCDGINTEDAIKFTNLHECIGLVREGKVLAAERKSLLQNSDTLFLKFWKTTPKNYLLQIAPTNIDIHQLFLKDNYLNTLTPISSSNTSNIAFSIGADVASAAANRFMIVLKKPTPLPITYISFTANLINTNQVATQWTVANQIDIEKYEIEKSVDGISFNKVATITNNLAGNIYKWVHVNPINGINYYRLKSYSLSGKIVYSNIAKVLVNTSNNIWIVNNPSIDNTIQLAVQGQLNGNYTCSIYNTNAQCITRQKLLVKNGTITLNLPNNTAKGLYSIEVIKSDNTKTTLPVRLY